MTGDERVKLVKRLREQAAAFGQHRDDRQRWADAADEIERLSGIIVCERIDTANLRAQLAAAQADSERLDWLEQEDPMCWQYQCDETDEMFWVANSTQSVEHRTLRYAIDAARKAEESDAQTREDFVGLVDPETEELP